MDSIEIGGLREIEGGVCAAVGFQAAGVACGIKQEGKRDLALVCCPSGASAAGAFTTNRVHSPAGKSVV